MFNSVFRRVSLSVSLLVVATMFAHTANAEIEWSESVEETLSKALETGKPIMMDFYTEWWGWCDRLDAETFTDARIIELAEKFVTVKVNPEITERPINAETQMRYGVTAFPAVLFISPDGGLIQKASGFMPPEQFSPIMEDALKKEKAFAEKLAEFEKMPDDAKLNAQVALTYIERMQLEKAVPISEKAIQLDPKNSTGLIPNLHNQLGLAYATKVENATNTNPEEAEMYFKKAVTHFRTLIDKYPKSELNEPAQYYLGVTYAIKGDLDDAIAVLEKLANHTTDENIKQNAQTMLTRVKELAGVK